MKNKKALSMTFIVILIVSVFTLILISSKVSNYLENASYESSIISCSSMLSNIDGKPQYFSNETYSPNSILINLIARTCNAKVVDVEKENTKFTTDLIKDCWAKSGKGSNFFHAELRDQGICLYCGTLNYKTHIPDFKDKLYVELSKETNKKLFESSQTIQLNNDLLMNSIPETINENDKYHVFYYIMRPTSDKVFRSYVTDLASIMPGVFEEIDYYFQENYLETFSGVILTNSNNVDSIVSTAVDSEEISEPSSGNCNYIIPNKIHN